MDKTTRGTVYVMRQAARGGPDATVAAEAIREALAELDEAVARHLDAAEPTSIEGEIAERSAEFEARGGLS